MVDGNPVMCGRFVVSIPDVMITILKSMQGDPDARLILRCPSCGKDKGRFSEVLFVNGKLTFRTMEERPSLGEVMEFEDIYVMAEGA